MAIVHINVGIMLKVFILLSFVGFALARNSPNADQIPELMSQGRYSNDIAEDARLDGPGLIRKYGYPIEMHSIITDDGYVLELHRIRHGKNSAYNPSGPVVFLQHGLLSSSADWVLMGPDNGLAYILADAGYDVWMGNARGNYYSRRHISLNPDRRAFWEFSWCDIGHIDIAEMIDYTLRQTGRSQLHYVGHSQGTTSFFVLMSSRPEYNSKIKSMHALAPVAYMGNLYSPFLRLLAPYSSTLDSLASLIGLYEFLPNNDLMTIGGAALCRDNSIFQPICYNTLFLIGGYNIDQMNATMLPVIMGHTPAGASTKQLVHYGQGINSGYFRKFDFGWLSNLLTYGSGSPPNYNLARISAPVALHYSDNDWLADVADVDALFRGLAAPIGKFRVPLAQFNHLDYMWAIDAKTLVYDRVISLMNAFERSG